MSDFFLDLRDKPRVIDFLVDDLELAPAKVRPEAEKWIRAYHDNEKVPTDKLADFAKRFAWSIWPVRFAMKRYFETEGADEEWRRVLAAVRPSTAHLLKRFGAGIKAASLDDVLKHAEADVALRDGDRVEINEIRKHLRQDYWREKSRHHGKKSQEGGIPPKAGKKTLAILVKEGEREAKAYHDRIAKLRDLALAMPRGFQDEIFSKLMRYEDRILFENEVVPLEILDDEVKYYTEQKEISPSEG